MRTKIQAIVIVCIFITFVGGILYLRTLQQSKQEKKNTSVGTSSVNITHDVPRSKYRQPTHYFPEIEYLRAYLSVGEFDKIEQKLFDINKEDKAGKRTFGTGFSETLDGFVISNNSGFLKQLEKWYTTTYSIESRLALCHYHLMQGFNERGGKTVDKTTQQQLRKMSGSFTNAEEHCMAIVEKFPTKYAYPYGALANIYFTVLGKPEAHDILQEGFRYFPEDKFLIRTYISKNIMRWGGNYVEAVKFSSAIPDKPELKFEKYGFPEYFLGMAKSMNKSNNPNSDKNEIKAHFLNSMEKGGLDTKPLSELSRLVLWKVSDEQKAAALVESKEYRLLMLDILPYYDDNLYELARNYYFSGDLKTAYDYAMKAYEIDPSNGDYDGLRMFIAKELNKKR